MAVKDDILALKQKQLELKKNKGRYVQMLKTPAVVPVAGVNNNEAWAGGKGLKPSDETEYVDFVPATKDYQYEVHTWTRAVNGGPAEEGFNIVARRDLGDGVIEIVMVPGGAKI